MESMVEAAIKYEKQDLPYEQKINGRYWTWAELRSSLSRVVREAYKEGAEDEKASWENEDWRNRDVIDRLCGNIHDLLGPFDGRDPGTNEPVDFVMSGAQIRRAQAVLAEVE